MNTQTWHVASPRGAALGNGTPEALRTAVYETRKRARRKGLRFNLTPEQCVMLWERSGGACELSGLPFDNEPGQHLWRPFAVSIARRDSADGYHFANVRLVCVCVNAALNQWGDEVFWRMVKSASEQIGKGDAEPSRPPFSLGGQK